MIDYAKVERGDILKLVGAGAPGHAELGDLLRVLEHTTNGVKVETKTGSTIEFVFNCGAARLEPTEWKNDFPIRKEGSGRLTNKDIPPTQEANMI